MGGVSGQGRWLRLDIRWQDSEWLDALDGHAANCWPPFLCYVKRNGVGGRCKMTGVAVLARHWRVARGDVEALVAAALAHGALVVEGDEWVVTGWAKYQPIDVTSAARQAKRREKIRRLK